MAPRSSLRRMWMWKGAVLLLIPPVSAVVSDSKLQRPDLGMCQNAGTSNLMVLLLVSLSNPEQNFPRKNGTPPQKKETHKTEK